MFDVILTVIITTPLVAFITWAMTHFHWSEKVSKLKDQHFTDLSKAALQSYDAGWRKGVAFGKMAESSRKNTLEIMKKPRENNKASNERVPS